MKLTILYSNKSSKTGKELKEKFKDYASKVIKKRTNRRLKTDVLLRWGSTEEFSRLTSRIELNTLQAVTNASNKFTMMNKLKRANIQTPEIKFDLENTDNLDDFRDEKGMFYVRGFNQEIRYTNELRYDDLYVSKPILNKRREYRVHVFNGEILAVYEKIPNDENVMLFKSYNCKFSAVNLSNTRLKDVDLQRSIDAVNALGLLFGGVDLCRCRNGETYVLEVNSSPSLNSININRYIEKITEYCKAMELLIIY
jgi:glutathione synthase/RimK-type ligase-like ATP-grasp enzyme